MKRSATCKLWIVGGVVAGAAALSLSGAAFGSGASGIEHLTFMSTNVTADKFNVIATGAFTAGGTATPLAAKDTLKFPNGTITATATSKGRPALTADTKTCLEALSQRGTYKIAGGTGAYSGMTGSGTFTLRIRAIGPIVNGKCELKTSRRVASQAIVTANGRITHK